jgi:hypothetical protein
MVPAARRLECSGPRYREIADWLPACQLPTGSSPCTSLSADSSIMLRSYSSIVSILIFYKESHMSQLGSGESFMCNAVRYHVGVTVAPRRSPGPLSFQDSWIFPVCGKPCERRTTPAWAEGQKVVLQHLGSALCTLEPFSDLRVVANRSNKITASS